MLREMSAADITLNELSRRVGLAKSNVLRYFPSREAVLLQLLDRETAAWLDDVESRLGEGLGEGLAAAIAAAAAARRVFCDLTASAPVVLERNVSGEVAADYKRASLASSDRLARLGGFDGLSSPGGLIFVAAVMMAIGGMWATSQPTEAMGAAYAEHPEFRPFRVEFETAVRELVATTLAGLEARGLAAS
jgi:AcrR family transcriptional regulator